MDLYATKKLRGMGMFRGSNNLTAEDIRNFRITLEDKTKDAYKKLDESRRACWVKAQSYVLD